MYRFASIEQVHLEVTSRCNAACPQCPRNLSGGPVNPSLPLEDLSVADVRAIFPDDFVRQLKSIYLCGNYGDPMVARDTLAILAYFRSCSATVKLGIHTNGSGRDARWWTDLAGLVDYCRFGIDGLEDTNAIYRRNTSWSRIMASVDAFVRAGGNAEWDFIVFEHNEHQVDLAIERSKQLGFSKFFVKRTGRFFSQHDPSSAQPREVRAPSGEPLYTIAAPRTAGFRNDAARSATESGHSRDSYRRHLESTPIRCKVTAPAKLYISAGALVLPCCHLGNIYPPHRPRPGSGALAVLALLPEALEKLDARRHGVREIVEGPFFQSIVPGGWQPGPLGTTRHEPCARVCGEGFDINAAQYSPSALR